VPSNSRQTLLSMLKVCPTILECHGYRLLFLPLAVFLHSLQVGDFFRKSTPSQSCAAICNHWINHLKLKLIVDLGQTFCPRTTIPEEKHLIFPPPPLHHREIIYYRKGFCRLWLFSFRHKVKRSWEQISSKKA
jgi:hypothetical protein